MQERRGKTKRERKEIRLAIAGLEKQPEGSMGLEEIYSNLELAGDSLFEDLVPELSNLAQLLGHISVAGTSRAVHEARFTIKGKNRHLFIVGKRLAIVHSMDKSSSKRRGKKTIVLLYPRQVGAILLCFWGIILPHYYSLQYRKAIDIEE